MIVGSCWYPTIILSRILLMQNILRSFVRLFDQCGRSPFSPSLNHQPGRYPDRLTSFFGSVGLKNVKPSTSNCFVGLRHCQLTLRENHSIIDSGVISDLGFPNPGQTINSLRFRLDIMFRAIFLALLCTLIPTQVAAQPIAVRVVSIQDGDTLTINQNGQATVVRLACIDNPDASQPGGAVALQRLRQLLPQGQSVQLIPVDVDQYGRTVGVVFANGYSVNLQMVWEGYAMVFDRYSSRGVG